MLKNEVVIMQIEAIYEHGVLRPIKPLSLAEGERVELRLITALAANAKRQAKREREARELEIINRNADRLNAEAMDVLDYQIEL
ncbi:MAG: antitoxin family protein [Acidobacteria bacterium]|nr:antitoxin family protein [Acidobacteriota bacterium]MBI3427947.1 antitoxin family protein [Acidobacteriota bacterium]